MDVLPEQRFHKRLVTASRRLHRRLTDGLQRMGGSLAKAVASEREQMRAQVQRADRRRAVIVRWLVVLPLGVVGAVGVGLIIALLAPLFITTVSGQRVAVAGLAIASLTVFWVVWIAGRSVRRTVEQFAGIMIAEFVVIGMIGVLRAIQTVIELLP